MLVQTFVSNAIETFLNRRSRDYRISTPLLVVWGCVSLWGQDRALSVSFQDRGSLLAFTWKIKVCAESLVYAAALETFSRLLLSLFCCFFFFFLRIFFLVKKEKKTASFKGCQAAFLSWANLALLCTFFHHFERCFLGILFYLRTVWPAEWRETGLSLLVRDRLLPANVL